jgi:PhzF family phenazine biosynthesis protein
VTGLPFFQVDAFVVDGKALTGNPAAVMPLEEWLPDDLMQAIALENNLSETAFLVPSERGDADYDLRWFTPTVEVDLCGHASIASGHVVIGERERVTFATRSGMLVVTRGEHGSLRLDLPAASVAPADLPVLVAALGVEGETFFGSEGNGNAILLLADEAAVKAVRPDFEALRALPYLVSITAPGERTDVASRVFAGAFGIDEDHVTGAAHAALTPFWAQRLARPRFTAFQASKRGGRLECEHRGDRVLLGGTCVTVIEGRLSV